MGRKSGNLPGPRIPIGTELAAENRLPDIALDLENHRATFRFSTELENEARVGFGPDNQVEAGRDFILFFPQFNPPVVEYSGSTVSAVESHRDPNPAEELARIHPARVPHPPRENRETHHERLAREATERRRVQVEAGGRRGGVRRRVAGN